MKAYVVTTGIVFGLVTLAHLLRVVVEHKSLFANPAFMLITLLSAALCAWAFLVLRRLRS